MRCSFLEHGLSLHYGKAVKPCCTWRVSADWEAEHHIDRVDLASWHNHPDLVVARESLEKGVWPASCFNCERAEEFGRGDSLRLGGLNSYGDYAPGDIVLEYRPGSTCNLSCYSCWPEASSKVAADYKAAFGITVAEEKKPITELEWIEPIKDRIRDVIVLGGEPFYDKRCKNFLNYINTHIPGTRLTLFTNGTVWPLMWLKDNTLRKTVVVSLDAVGEAAESVRKGTSWRIVSTNYKKWLDSDAEVRVNTTVSPMNVMHLAPLLKWLAKHPPALITWDNASDSWMQPEVIPPKLRPVAVAMVRRALDEVAGLPVGLRENTRSFLEVLVARLSSDEYNSDEAKEFVRRISALTRVKGEESGPVVDMLSAFKHCMEK